MCHSCECSCLWDSTEAKPVLKKSFIMFCWICSIASPPFPLFKQLFKLLICFSFLLFLTFYDISDKFTVCLYLFICAPHQAAIVLSSSSSSLSGLLVRRCHLLLLCPSTYQKVLLSSSSQSLCERAKGSCKVVSKAEVTDCCCCSNDCFQFTEEYPFAKNVSVRVKCS